MHLPKRLPVLVFSIKYRPRIIHTFCVKPGVKQVQNILFKNLEIALHHNYLVVVIDD